MKSLRPLILFLAAALVSALGVAQPTTHSSRTTNIRAGVVILASDRAGFDGALTPPEVLHNASAPYALYNLDRSPIKPNGWNLFNPHAPGSVTPEIRQRYLRLASIGGTGINAGMIPTEFDRLSKRNAEYWNVYVDRISDDLLADYDLLLLSPFAAVSLTPAERARLIRFVDQGGILWIDPSGVEGFTPGQDAANPYPAAFTLSPTGAAYPYAIPDSPLLNRPNQISPADLAILHSVKRFGLTQIFPTAATGLDGRLTGSLEGEYFRYRFASIAKGLPTMAFAAIGEGYVVTTANGVALMLNRTAGAGYNDNRGYSALNPVLDADARAAARVAVNIISLAGGAESDAGGSRRASASPLDTSAPVLERFTNTNVGGTGVETYTPSTGAAISDGVVVAVEGNFVVAYDSNPNRDLDGDGDGDDGIRDLSLGQPHDVIWRSRDLGAGLSNPVVSEANAVNSSSNFTSVSLYQKRVLVTDSTGTLHVFALVPRIGSGLIGPAVEIASIAPPASTAGQYPNGRAFSPAVVDGLAILVDNVTNAGNAVGRVWVADILNGVRLSTANDWFAGGASGQSLPRFTAGATVGYIPIADNSGGSDRVIYIPGMSNGTEAPTIVSLWLGAKGERPSNVTVNGNSLEIVTRAGSGRQLPVGLTPPPNRLDLGFRVTLLRRVAPGSTSSQPVPAGQLGNYLSSVPPTSPGPGQITLQLSNPTAYESDIVGVRVDYTVDWGAAPGSPNIERLRAQLPIPDNRSAIPNFRREILGSIALTPRGTAYLTVGDPRVLEGFRPAPSPDEPPGSAIFGFREDAGRGALRMVMRYDLYSRHDITINQTTSRQYPSVIEDNDPVRDFAGPFLTGEMRQFRFVGSPAIRNGVLYALATARKPIPAIGLTQPVVDVTALLAFRAEPETPELRVGVLPDNAAIVQRDFQRSANQSRPERESVMNSSSYVYDRANGVVRFENLAGNPQNQNINIQNSISLSQPVIIRVPNQPDQLRDPMAAADRWSPLLWYTVFNGVRATAGLYASGGTVYMSGATSILDILNGILPPVAQERGILWAVDAESMGSNPQFVVNPTRPPRSWLTQVANIVRSGTEIVANPGIRMPQLVGVRSFETFRDRLAQALIGPSQTPPVSGFSPAYRVVAGDGIVAATGPFGLFAYNRADVWVADEGRLAKFDAGGNPLYTSSDTISPSAIGGPVGIARNLVRPVRAYELDGNELAVVDSGGNRVVRFDTSGTEIRSLAAFQIDPARVPPGFQSGDNQRLRNPSDVAIFKRYVPLPANAADRLSGQTGLEYWIHYLIADTGNRRLIELVDRYQADPTTGAIGGPVVAAIVDPEDPAATSRNVPQLGILTWHSPADVSGKEFRYHSVSRVFVPDVSGGRYVYVAGLGNANPSAADSGRVAASGTTARDAAAGNGGIVIFDPTLPSGARVYNRFTSPNLTSTPFWNPATSSFATNPDLTSRPRFFSGVESVTARTVPSGGGSIALSLTVADRDAVYEFRVNPSANEDDVLPVPSWMINERAFLTLRSTTYVGPPTNQNPRRFRPKFARRLDNGEILVVNGYVGELQDSQSYRGEILMLEGRTDPGNDIRSGQFSYAKSNLGFNYISIRYELPPITGVRGIFAPIFADRR